MGLESKRKQPNRRLVIADAYVLAHRIIEVAVEIDRQMDALNALGDEGEIPDPLPDDYDLGTTVEGAFYDFAGVLGTGHHHDPRSAAERFTAAIDRLTGA